MWLFRGLGPCPKKFLVARLIWGENDKGANLTEILRAPGVSIAPLSPKNYMKLQKKKQDKLHILYLQAFPCI